MKFSLPRFSNRAAGAENVWKIGLRNFRVRGDIFKLLPERIFSHRVWFGVKIVPLNLVITLRSLGYFKIFGFENIIVSKIAKQCVIVGNALKFQDNLT